jgi:DNA-binding CsgD family transcriptional regulator
MFWRVFPDSRVPMLILDDEAVYTAANGAACRSLGRRREDIVGHRLGFSSSPELRARLAETWAHLRDEGYILVPWQLTLPDGSVASIEAICTADTPEPGRHLALCWPAPQNGERVLSPREEEITALLARGLTGEQIAQRLFLSPETVRTHIRNAMMRMRAGTRAQLVALAIERGIIPSDL